MATVHPKHSTTTPVLRVLLGPRNKGDYAPELEIGKD